MKKQILLSISAFLFIACSFGQSIDSKNIDLAEAITIIDSLDKKFSKHFFEGDSIALYNMYAKGAYFNTSKGNDILLEWGKHIRYSIKNDTRSFTFNTTSLTSDEEFLFELGTYKMEDSKGNIKGEGKYILVWKQEDGEWKIYRDMGL
jgi:ketosteroid isomerase-like protein